MFQAFNEVKIKTFWLFLKLFENKSFLLLSKKSENNPFWLMVATYVLMLALAHQGQRYLWDPSLTFVFSLIVIGGAFISYKRFVKKELIFNKILFYTSLSFGLYGLIQSPVFPPSEHTFEIIYFISKFTIYGAVTYYFYKRGFCNLFSYLLLVGFLADSTYMSFINQGYLKSPTEYYSVLETSAILLIISSLFEKNNIQENGAIEAKSAIPVLYVMAHLSNYWVSGYAKVTLNGGPLSWLSNTTMASLKRAGLWDQPMEAYSDFILSFPYIHVTQFISNVFVYVTQLLSAFVSFFPILLAPLTIIYDIFHVAVGALAGVFFYKWILVNLIILFNYKSITKTLRSYGWGRKIILSGVVMSSFWIGTFEPLGWYETRQFNLVHAHGTDINGDVHKLHTQFFGSTSFMITNKSTKAFAVGHLPMASVDYETMLQARSCSVPLKKTDYYLANREIVTDLAQRYLGDERSAFSKIMLYLQPYHLAIPHWNKRNTMFGPPLESITFDLYNYCVDENFSLYHEEILDSFTVKKES